MCFKEDSTIFQLNGKPLKLVDLFIYFSIYISSTESDVSIRIGKAWVAYDRSMIKWKSDLFDKIKEEFFQAAAMSVLLLDSTS